MAPPKRGSVKLSSVHPTEAELAEARATISGASDISRSRSETRKAADGYAMAADLAVHSRTLKTLAGGNQQNQQIAAQILSSSCVNSGHLLRTVPTRAVHMGNERQVSPASAFAVWRADRCAPE